MEGFVLTSNHKMLKFTRQLGFELHRDMGEAIPSASSRRFKSYAISPRPADAPSAWFPAGGSE
ncbi:MAG: hypothetical protein M5R42_04370 [Rhodocyclaceae bacterium]|nr:hypothetical protein [Rhodocyclaceae bacterium]